MIIDETVLDWTSCYNTHHASHRRLRCAQGTLRGAEKGWCARAQAYALPSSCKCTVPLQTLTICSTARFPLSVRVPMRNVTKSDMWVVAMARRARGNVALNIRVCRSGRHCSTSKRSCGSNPELWRTRTHNANKHAHIHACTRGVRCVGCQYIKLLGTWLSKHYIKLLGTWLSKHYIKLLGTWLSKQYIKLLGTWLSNCLVRGSVSTIF